MNHVRTAPAAALAGLALLALCTPAHAQFRFAGSRNAFFTPFWGSSLASFPNPAYYANSWGGYGGWGGGYAPSYGGVDYYGGLSPYLYGSTAAFSPPTYITAAYSSSVGTSRSLVSMRRPLLSPTPYTEPSFVRPAAVDDAGYAGSSGSIRTAALSDSGSNVPLPLQNLNIPWYPPCYSYAYGAFYYWPGSYYYFPPCKW